MTKCPEKIEISLEWYDNAVVVERQECEKKISSVPFAAILSFAIWPLLNLARGVIVAYCNNLTLKSHVLNIAEPRASREWKD